MLALPLVVVGIPLIDMIDMSAVRTEKLKGASRRDGAVDLKGTQDPKVGGPDSPHLPPPTKVKPRVECFPR